MNWRTRNGREGNSHAWVDYCHGVGVRCFDGSRCAGGQDRRRGHPRSTRRRRADLRTQQASRWRAGLQERPHRHPDARRHLSQHRVRPSARRQVLDGLHGGQGLRRLRPRPARLRALDPASGHGCARRPECALHEHRRRLQGTGGGGRLRAQAAGRRQGQPHRLVVGHRHNGGLYGGQPGQGRAARALRAGLAAHHSFAGAGPGQARRLPRGEPTRRSAAG